MNLSSLSPRHASSATRLLPHALAIAAAGLAASAVCTEIAAARAERRYPPSGRFVTVDGVRLHFIDTGGPGPVLVLLHGNGGMVADMQISGLVAAAAKHYRVLAFDRPGFGYSERPRGRSWGPKAQAELFARAFVKLGIGQPLVFGHSWGTLVALALGLDHGDSIRGLTLASGYYFPTARVDVIAAIPKRLPLLGDLLRHTISPAIGRISAPGVFRKLFAPRPVSLRFREAFPLDLTLRPSQIRANAEETALMVSAAAELANRYSELRLPVCIIAGADDRVVDTDRQSVRLRESISHADLRVLPGLGHMVHYFATEQIVSAMDQITAATRTPPRSNLK